jgi:hypothetical protein
MLARDFNPWPASPPSPLPDLSRFRACLRFLPCDTFLPQQATIAPPMSERTAERPTRQELERVLERTRERIESLLRRRQCTSKIATELLREALVVLAHRWNRIGDRDQWLLDRIEKAVRHAEDPSLEDPLDDEKPPS